MVQKSIEINFFYLIFFLFLISFVFNEAIVYDRIGTPILKKMDNGTKAYDRDFDVYDFFYHSLLNVFLWSVIYLCFYYLEYEKSLNTS